MMIPKMKIIRDEKHRRFIASLPCSASGVTGRSQAAHIRHGGAGGMGMKPSDDLCIPLSVEEHYKQHNKHNNGYGEENFWHAFGGIEAAKKLAKDLYECSGDYVKACELIGAFRMRPNF